MLDRSRFSERTGVFLLSESKINRLCAQEPKSAATNLWYGKRDQVLCCVYERELSWEEALSTTPGTENFIVLEHTVYLSDQHG